jgi:hypothetical protein
MASGIFASNKPGTPRLRFLLRAAPVYQRRHASPLSGERTGGRAARGGLARLNAPDAGKSPATLPPTTDCRR